MGIMELLMGFNVGYNSNLLSSMHKLFFENHLHNGNCTEFHFQIAIDTFAILFKKMITEKFIIYAFFL